MVTPAPTITSYPFVLGATCLPGYLSSTPSSAEANPQPEARPDLSLAQQELRQLTQGHIKSIAPPRPGKQYLSTNIPALRHLAYQIQMTAPEVPGRTRFSRTLINRVKDHFLELAACPLDPVSSRPVLLRPCEDRYEKPINPAQRYALALRVLIEIALGYEDKYFDSGSREQKLRRKLVLADLARATFNKYQQRHSGEYRILKEDQQLTFINFVLRGYLPPTQALNDFVMRHFIDVYKGRSSPYAILDIISFLQIFHTESCAFFRAHIKAEQQQHEQSQKGMANPTPYSSPLTGLLSQSARARLPE